MASRRLARCLQACRGDPGTGRFICAGSPMSPRCLLRGSPALLNSPLLGTAVPLHGQFDVGGASRPPGVQSPEDREHGAHQKARGLLPTAPPPSPGPVSQTECKLRPEGQTRDWKARGLGWPDFSVVHFPGLLKLPTAKDPFVDLFLNHYRRILW